MKNLKAVFLSCIIIGSGLSLSAQTQFSGWIATFHTYSLDKKFSIHFDGQWRSTDQVQHMQTLLLRWGLNIKVRKNMTATGGYAYIHNRRVITGISGYAPEHRFWEQFIVSHKFGRGSLAHRFRLEQRLIGKSFIDNNEFKNDGNVFANRFRYFFRAYIPIVEAKGPFLALQNEVFLNYGDKSVVNGKVFDQNRAYAALGYRFSKAFDAEVGYMNQYNSGTNNAFVNNHIFQVATYIRL